MMPGLLKTRNFAAALVILFVLPALADEVDIENAPTPTRLVELLPEGGFDAVKLDVWTSTTMTMQDGRISPLNSYHHWSIKTDAGKLVIELALCRPMPHGSKTLQRFIYSADGTLEAYHELRESRGKPTADLIGKVEGDELVIKPNPEVGILNANLSRERSVPLATFDTHVPVAWVPLVRAYHMRNGHLGYEYATVDLTRSNEKIKRSVEDVGSEQVEVAGESVLGHLLLEKIVREGKGKRQGVATESQALVQTNGAAFNGTSRQKRYTYTTKRVSEEEARDRLGIEGKQADQE